MVQSMGWMRPEAGTVWKEQHSSGEMSLFFWSPETWSASILLLQESLGKSLMALEGLRPDVTDKQLQPVPLSCWELKRGLSAAGPAWDPCRCQDCSGRGRGHRRRQGSGLSSLTAHHLTQEGDRRANWGHKRPNAGQDVKCAVPSLGCCGKEQPSGVGRA